MKKLELLIPPPLVMVLVALMMWACLKVFPALTLIWFQSTGIACFFALLGLVISVISMVAFKNARTTMDPKHPASAAQLISTGIYRYSRNPMYLGVWLMLVGWSFYLGNVVSILGLVIFMAYITRFQIMPEERLLSQKFGATFDSYKHKVRRWL